MRDTLKNVPVKDIDLATPADPETVLTAAERAGYRVIPTGLQHGTVTIVIEGIGYEVTTLRRDVETDGRHAKVAFVTDYETDAARRDFTINAMSADLDGTVHDYFGGRADLFNRRIAFVGNMDDRITEDYLRILRFYRFRARYGGAEDQGYVENIGRHANGLHRISGERIWSEIGRILVSDRAHSIMGDMRRTGVLEASGLRIAELGRYSVPLGLNRRSEGRSGLMLGFVVDDRNALDAVCDRWRVSTIERQQAELALDIREIVAAARHREDESIHDWYFWTDRLVEGDPVPETLAALRTLGLDTVASEIPSDVPVFPVKGQDLLDHGMTPGKEIGSVLRRLKDAWKSKGYTPSREDLLARHFGGDFEGSGGIRP